MSEKLSKDQLSELIEQLQFIEDPRVLGRSKHLLVDILVLSICAVLCGAEGILEIQAFGEQKENWLKEFLELPAGIPSHDTIARVLSLVDPLQVEVAFGVWVQWILSSREKIKSLSLDGKSSKGTERGFNTAHRPLMIVSAYAHELGLTLMQSESGSSGLAEGDAALECLDVLDVDGITVMADAGLATRPIVEKIRQKKGDYIVPIKGNHRRSFTEIEGYFEKHSGKRIEVMEEGHGRKEKRSCRVLSVSTMSELFLSRWPDAKVVFEITRERHERDRRFVVQKTDKDGKQYYEKNEGQTKSSKETTYYVSSLDLSAKEALVEIRKHWQIENNLHWVLDVAFREDDWTVRAKRLARSLALIRKIALNIIRNSNTKGSVKGRMKKAGWNNEFLGELLFGGRF